MQADRSSAARPSAQSAHVRSESDDDDDFEVLIVDPTTGVASAPPASSSTSRPPRTRNGLFHTTISAPAPSSAPTAPALPALSAQTAASALAQFAETALQTVLSARRVYPPSCFEARAAPGGALVPAARHPLLQAYLARLSALVQQRVAGPGHYRLIVPLLPPAKATATPVVAMAPAAMTDADADTYSSSSSSSSAGANAHATPIDVTEAASASSSSVSASASASVAPDGTPSTNAGTHAGTHAGPQVAVAVAYPTLLPLERFVFDLTISAPRLISSQSTATAPATATAAEVDAAETETESMLLPLPLPLLPASALSELQTHLCIALTRLGTLARAGLRRPSVPRGSSFRLLLCDNSDAVKSNNSGGGGAAVVASAAGLLAASAGPSAASDCSDCSDYGDCCPAACGRARPSGRLIVAGPGALVAPAAARTVRPAHDFAWQYRAPLQTRAHRAAGGAAGLGASASASASASTGATGVLWVTGEVHVAVFAEEFELEDE